MDSILVKPRNQEELNLLIALFKRMDIVFQVVSEDKGGKK